MMAVPVFWTAWKKARALLGMLRVGKWLVCGTGSPWGSNCVGSFAKPVLDEEKDGQRQGKVIT